MGVLVLYSFVGAFALIGIAVTIVIGYREVEEYLPWRLVQRLDSLENTLGNNHYYTKTRLDRHAAQLAILEAAITEISEGKYAKRKA